MTSDYTLPDRGRVALLSINAQRDFTLAGSPLRANGVSPAIGGVKNLVSGFRQAGVPIVHAIRLYRPDGSNVDSFRRQMVEEGMRVLMPGTRGAELIEEINPGRSIRLDPNSLLSGTFQEVGSDEWVAYKPRWGAFHGTNLEGHLRSLGVTTLVLCGFNFATSGRATIYEAGARDFRIVVVPDAISGGSDEAVTELGRIGVYLMTADECLTWLGSAGAPVAAA